MFTRMVTKETTSMACSQNVPLLNSSFILMADKDDFRKEQKFYIHVITPSRKHKYQTDIHDMNKKERLFLSLLLQKKRLGTKGAPQKMQYISQELFPL